MVIRSQPQFCLVPISLCQKGRKRVNATPQAKARAF
jgi:hypothetical protein